jgi:hypothetical protein
MIAIVGMESRVVVSVDEGEKKENERGMFARNKFQIRDNGISQLPGARAGLIFRADYGGAARGLHISAHRDRSQ